MNMLSPVIVTIEPDNIKTILSTKFNDYSLGKTRKISFVPVFGHGIFTTDGAAWERSRGMVRPNFTRQQVADLDMFEAHVSHLIDSIPRDGSTVDLQNLFFALTMDSATEFLFGRSTNTLGPGLETRSEGEFVKAFVYATEGTSPLSSGSSSMQLIRVYSHLDQLPLRRLDGIDPGSEVAQERQDHPQLCRQHY